LLSFLLYLQSAHNPYRQKIIKKSDLFALEDKIRFFLPDGL